MFHCLWNCGVALGIATSMLPNLPVSAEPLDLGHRLELMVDDYLVEEVEGLQWQLHESVDRGPVFKPTEVPWEQNSTGYGTVIYDNGVYRMYYRADPDLALGKYAYAESRDGIHWERPSLGLHEFNGSKDNNIIIAGPNGGHSFSPFLDTNPQALPSERYKATGLLRTPDNKSWLLLAFASPDGIHWRQMQEAPIITEGALDSQNVAFWSESEQQYLVYYRTKSQGRKGLRQISRATSSDFLNWSQGVTMQYRRLGKDMPLEQMYTNQTRPYFRAPHLYVSTAARFMQGRKALTDDQIAEAPRGNYADCSDAVLMTSRGDNYYDRTFMEGWIRPGFGIENWGTRSNYPFLGIVPTGENEMSIYTVKAYSLPGVHVHRYSLRLDGLGSLSAGYDGGTMTTRPLICPGGTLTLNMSTSAAGSVSVELLDEAGNVLPGFEASACGEMIGDQIDRPVSWAGQRDLAEIKGHNIRLRFTLKDADLYALRFSPTTMD